MSSGPVLCGTEAEAMTLTLALDTGARVCGTQTADCPLECGRCAVERGDACLCRWLRVLGDGHTTGLAARYPPPPSAKKKSKKAKQTKRTQREDERELESQCGGFRSWRTGKHRAFAGLGTPGRAGRRVTLGGLSHRGAGRELT